MLSDVVVERDGDDVLLVSWSSADGVAVDVCVGSAPTPAEHLHVATSTDGVVRLPAVSGRAYVSLRPVDGDTTLVVAERRVPFVGITNFRDLGGYPTSDGGTTRWGRVYRADALHKLTGADVEALGGLGVRTVFDLRGDLERDEFPDPVPSQHVPIVGRPPGAELPTPRPDMTEADGERLLRDIYVGVLEHSAANIATVLRCMSTPDTLPVVFHCHGGKDRTGVVASVLLLAVGVDRETVLDDYEATRRYRRPEHQGDSLANLLAAGVSAEAAAGVLGTPRWAMAAAVDALDDVYGGVHRYLTAVAGLEPSELRALQDCLVEPGRRSTGVTPSRCA